MSPCGRFSRFRRTQSFVFLVTCPTCPINVSDLTSRGDQCAHPKSSQAKLSQDQQSLCNSPHQISNKLNTGQWSMLPTAYLPQPNSSTPSTPSTLYCILVIEVYWAWRFVFSGASWAQLLGLLGKPHENKDSQPTTDNTTPDMISQTLAGSDMTRICRICRIHSAEFG